MLGQPHAITDQKCVGKHSVFVGIWRYVVYRHTHTPHIVQKITHCTCNNYK